jgi:hypothetical protein
MTQNNKAGEENAPSEPSSPESVDGIRNRVLSWRKQLAFLGILAIAFLLLQEIVLRILFPVPDVANFNRSMYSQMFHDGSKKMGRGKFLSNASYIHASDPDGVEFVHSLNLYGFRDRQWALKKPKGHERIMFFGDSFMEGAMAEDESTIPEGFRAAADEQGYKVDVMNLGIQAMGLPGYVVLMADSVPVFKPDKVVVVFYENDFYSPIPFMPQWMNGRGLQPEYNSVWTPRLMPLLRNLSAAQPNPRRWTAAPFSFFAKVPDVRNPFSNPQVKAQLAQFVDPEIADSMSKGRFNPYIIDEYLADQEEVKKPINVSRYLIAMKQLLDGSGIELLTAYIPINHQVSDHYIPFQLKFSRARQVNSLTTPDYQIHQETLQTQCDALEIPFLDFTPMLRKLETEGQRMYWNYDNHMKGESYFFIGYQLHEWMQSLTKNK